MDKYLSNKIKVLSLLCMFGILMIHSTYTEGNQWAFSGVMQRFFGLNVFESCVSLYFVISGYLFFYSLPESGMRGIFPKWKSRIRTLLLPYIYWNLLFFASMLALKLMPIVNGFVNSDFLSVVQSGDVLYILKVLFVEPAGFHLWFVEYLIAFILTAPLLFLGIRYGKWLFLIAIIGVFGFYGLGDKYVQGILFFALGAFLSYYRIEIDTRLLKRKYVYSLIACFFLFSFFNASGIVAIPYWGMWLLLSLGVCCFWVMYDQLILFLSEFGFGKLLKYSSFSFFIYAFHEPWLNIYKKIFPMLLGREQWVYVVGYFVSPILMFVTSIGVAQLLKKICPTVYFALTGGRGVSSR